MSALGEWNLCLKLPWPNRRRPFLALHLVRWGHRCGPKPGTIYRYGIGIGRQFMPTNNNGRWHWGEFIVPTKRKPLHLQLTDGVDFLLGVVGACFVVWVVLVLA